MNTKPKCVIIGWDGATYDIITPLLGNGALPNLQKLMASGTYGTMNSSVPPFTAMAWSSFATGLNPGRHGLFSFWGRYIANSSEKGYIRKPLDSKHLDGKTLWAHLSNHGKRVGVVNFPMAYPAEKVNGLLIGGMLSPSINRDFIYPPEEYEELFKVAPKYRIDVDFNIIRKGNLDAYIEHVDTMIEQRINSVLYYWEKEKWDLFVAIFTECDRLQHVLWHCIDSNHPAFNDNINKRWGNIITKAYKKLDAVLGYIMDTVDSETTIMLLSDHGFGPSSYRVHMNALLKEMGLLCTKLIMREGHETEIIDWEHTRAYSGHTYEHCVFVNLRGRDYFGLVSPGEEYHNLLKTLSNAISQIKDPISGQPIVTNVFTANDIYWGEYTFHAPDLVYETVNGAYLHSDTLSPKKIIEPVTWHTGSHRKDGIYVLTGPNVCRGRSEAANLQDVYPTVSSIFGVPYPQLIDGIIMKQCFESEYIERICDLWNCKTDLSIDDDTEELKRRLKAVGYFD